MAPSPLVLSYMSVLLEALFVGVYSVLAAFIVHIVLVQRRTKGSNGLHRFLFGASIFMYLVSVTHIGLLIQQYTATEPKAAKINAQVQIALATAQFMAADLVLIWRVWLVWGRNYYVAAFPTALLCVNTGLNINFATMHTGIDKDFNLISVALVFVNTFICTSLIAGKILYIRYQLNQSFFGSKSRHSNGYMSALLLIIESGVGYSFVQLTSLIVSKTKSPGQGIVLNSAIPLLGIFPTLIIIFVHYNQSLGDKAVSDRATGQASTMKFEAGRAISGTNSSHVQLSTIAGSGGQKTVFSTSRGSENDEWKTSSRDLVV